MSSEATKNSIKRSSEDKIIEIIDMNKWFGDFHVLIDINLNCLQG